MNPKVLHRSIKVPIHVDAIVLNGRLSVAEALHDRHVTRIDHERHPVLADQCGRSAMSEPSATLSPGVHIHWSMPDRLSRAQTEPPVNKDAFIKVDGVYFPALPDRWWIGKTPPKLIGGRDRFWVIESDADRPDQQRGGLRTRGSNFCPLGQRLEMEEISNLYTGPARRKLSAVGWTEIGEEDKVLMPDPYFAAFYPSCNSMFGFHDPQVDRKALLDTTYTVIGWYSNPCNDPAREWSSRFTDPDKAGDFLESQDISPTGDRTAILAQANAIHFTEHTGWKHSQSSSVAPSSTILCGEVRNPANVRAMQQEKIYPTVAIGSTPTEAAAALLASTLDDDAAIRARETEFFQIAHHKRLVGHRLDALQQLRDARHTNSFIPVGTQVVWQVTDAPTAMAQGHDGLTRRRNDDLPPDLLRRLAQLNAAEEALTNARNAKASLQQELFEIWQFGLRGWKLVGNANVIAAHENRLLAKHRDLKAAVIKLTQHDQNRDAAVDQTLACLDRCNQRRDTRDHLTIQQAQGPRYWRPADPTLALDAQAHSHKFRATARYGTTAASLPCDLASFVPHGWKGQLCTLAERLSHEITPPVLIESIDVMKISREFKSLDGPSKEFWKTAVNLKGGAAWHPIFAEWMIAFAAPLAVRDGDGPMSRYHPGAISDNFAVPADCAEFSSLDPGLFDPDPALAVEVVGRSLVNQAGRDDLLDAMDKARDRIDGKVADLKGKLDATSGALRTELQTLQSQLNSVVERFSGAAGEGRKYATIQLSGFFEALLARKTGPQLPFLSPHSYWGGKIESALADAPGLASTHPGGPFEAFATGPFEALATGELNVMGGQVIDCFGQMLAWSPKGGSDDVVPAESLSSPDRKRAILPPRLVQPSRLNFRWLSADDDDTQSNDHPASSPVCGWLVPSHLNDWILVYDQSGKLLGYINEARIWQPNPGDLTAPAGPAQMENTHLGRVVSAFIARTADNQNTEMAGLIKDIKQIITQIEPKVPEAHMVQAVFSGRPIAVARANVSMSQKGPPARQLRLFEGKIEKVDAMFYEPGIEALRVPVHIGETGKLHDGVIVFFADQTDTDLRDQCARCVDHLATIPDLHLPNDRLQLTVAGPGQKITVLLDPRCAIHLKCGLLPTKTISIPQIHFSPHLASMESLFAAGPLLMPGGGIEVPIPRDPGHTSAWVSVENGQWSEVSSQPAITYADLAAAFPGHLQLPVDGLSEFEQPAVQRPGDNTIPRAAYLWSQLLAHGWLEQIDDTTACILSGSGKTLPYFQANEVQQALYRISSRMAPPDRPATFKVRSVARSGWIRLKPRRSRGVPQVQDP